MQYYLENAYEINEMYFSDKMQSKQDDFVAVLHKTFF